MTKIDDLKEEIAEKKNRIKFGFNLVRSMEQRIESKETQIEDFKLTAEADLNKTKAEARKWLITAMTVAVFNIFAALHLKIVGLLIIAYLSEEIANAHTGNSSILEREMEPKYVFSGGFVETIKDSYLSYENIEIFTFISLIVVSVYLLMKLTNYYRSIFNRSVQKHIEIHDLKIINKMNCYHGYIIKVRNEIQRDRLKIREAKYKLRLLERK